MNPRSVLERGSPRLLSRMSASWVASHGARSPAQSKAGSTLVAALVFLASAVIAGAQSYSIDWHTIGGGGGASAGGVFSVRGTIGQADAGGPLANGGYSITGGFWALPFTVQIPGAPTLTIAPSGRGQAQISWTPNTPGYVLQETSSLRPANWVNSASGTANPVTVTPTPPTKYYRLTKP